VSATPIAGTGYGAVAAGSCSASGTSCTASGLVDGITYAVTVTATNAWGTSSDSAAVDAIPYPESIMSGNAFAFWLDAADSSTLYSDPSETVPAMPGDGVAVWKDRTGHGYDAAQPWDADPPALTAAALSGRTALRFSRDGTNPTWLEITQPGNKNVITADHTLFVVGQSRTTADGDTDSTNAYLVWQGYHDGLFATGYPTTDRLQSDSWTPNGTSNATSVLVSGPAVMSSTVTGDNTTNTVYANGTTGVGSDPQGGFDDKPDVAHIGAAYDERQPGGYGYGWFLDGDIGEILAFSTPLDAAQRRVVHEYLARKWGIGIEPSAPAAPSVTAGDGSLSVSWPAPWDGGSAVTGYTVTATPVDGLGYGALPDRTCSTGGALSCSVTGLVNGITYSVTVTATNAQGTSAPSIAASAIPYPAGVMSGASFVEWLDGGDLGTMSQDSAGTTPVTAAGQSVGLWRDKSTASMSRNNAAQASSGLRPSTSTVAGHVVPNFDGSSSYLSLDPAALPTGSATSTAFVVAGLQDPDPSNSVWRVAFSWGDESGPGDARQISKDEWGAAVLTDLNNYVARNDSGTWSTSATVVASQVTSSTSTLWTAGTPAASSSGTPATGTSYADVGRKAGHNTEFWQGPVEEVLVFSAALTGAGRRQVEEYLARKWASPITPTAPRGLTVTPGNGQLTVSWTAPLWDGGSGVTQYTATASGGSSCTTAGTSCTITGLASGTPYTVDVAATNGLGAGPSATAAGTPN
jgi:hypothetical protein